MYAGSCRTFRDKALSKIEKGCSISFGIVALLKIFIRPVAKKELCAPGLVDEPKRK